MKKYIIYDNNGQLFFLICKNKDGSWSLFSSKSNIEESLFIYKINKKYEFDFNNIMVEVYEANMNLPVKINEELYDTYLWTTYEGLKSKLSNEDLEIVNKFLSNLR